jgi:hypothetical protein
MHSLLFYIFKHDKQTEWGQFFRIFGTLSKLKAD